MQLRTFISTTLIFFSVAAIAQTPDFSKIDANARSIQYKYGQDIKALAKALANGCTSEKDKARAIFVWITDNIKYDVKTFENRKEIDVEKAVAMQVPQQVLKSKKAVCAGYSNLFVELSQELGLQAIRVTGLTKNSRGTVARAGHAWCLVRADGNWGLLDPTWGAGDVDMDEGKYTERFKEKFFFTAPEVLIEDHYPSDPLFQMLPNPLTFDEFKQAEADKKASQAKKMTGSPRPGYANLADSLNVFAALDSVQMLYPMGKRVLEIEPGSNYGLYNLGLYQFRIGFQSINTYQQEMRAWQASGKTFTAKWCDQQIILLKNAKKQLTESITTFNRSTRTDNLSTSIRSCRQSAEMALETIEKNQESMKKMRERAK